MKARVKWAGERTFVGETASGHEVTLGTAHGDGAKPGPSAMELVLIGAGGCSAWDVVNILEKSRAGMATAPSSSTPTARPRSRGSSPASTCTSW